MLDAEYRDARTNYLRALDVYIPNNEEARESLDLCDSMLTLEPEFTRLIIQGDSYFNLGINHYDLAFEIYYQADNLNYNDEEAEKVITDKKSDAIKKYIDVAKIENEEGHTDIAFSHLSKAYKLDNSENTILQSFITIVSSSSTANLKTSSLTIKSENPNVINDLLGLLSKAEAGVSDPEKYELIRSSLAK